MDFFFFFVTWDHFYCASLSTVWDGRTTQKNTRSYCFSLIIGFFSHPVLQPLQSRNLMETVNIKTNLALVGIFWIPLTEPWIRLLLNLNAMPLFSSIKIKQKNQNIHVFMMVRTRYVVKGRFYQNLSKFIYNVKGVFPVFSTNTGKQRFLKDSLVLFVCLFLKLSPTPSKIQQQLFITED